jgi:hypothetical protein
MTNATRLANVVDNLTNTTSTNPQVLRIAARLLPLAVNDIANDGKVLATLTNEEKAGYVLTVMRRQLQALLRSQAQSQEQTTVQTTVDTNVTAAVADL